MLQHYIKTGKSEKEIKKTIYQFCVSLKIQSPRVCEGVTELFGSEVIYVLGKVKYGKKTEHSIGSFLTAVVSLYNTIIGYGRTLMGVG